MNFINACISQLIKRLHLIQCLHFHVNSILYFIDLWKITNGTYSSDQDINSLVYKPQEKNEKSRRLEHLTKRMKTGYH